MTYSIFGIEFGTALLWAIPAFSMAIFLLILCWILCVRRKREKKISDCFTSASFSKYYELVKDDPWEEESDFEQEELLMELPDESSDMFKAAKIFLEDQYSDFRTFLLDYINLSTDAFFEKYAALYEKLDPSEEKYAKKSKLEFCGRYEGRTLDRIVYKLLINWIESTTAWRSFPVCLNHRCESSEILCVIRQILKEIYNIDLVQFNIPLKNYSQKSSCNTEKPSCNTDDSLNNVKADLPAAEILKVMDRQLRTLGLALILAADYSDDYYFGIFPIQKVNALNGLKLPSMTLRDSETFFNAP